MVFVRDGLLPMELGLVHQLFGQARSPAGQPLYELVTCALKPGRVRTDTDFPVVVEHGTEALREADTVIVPASHETDTTETDGRLSGQTAEAVARIRSGARIASICTGAFLLAAANLLDDRRATTHWKSAERFRKLYPSVRLDPDVLYVDEGRVLTSAGEAAGIDLCLHMIRNDHGSAIANDVARATVVPPHRNGGQAQFMKCPMPEANGDSTNRARAWALRNLHRRLTLGDLAAQELMSTRTFTRRFRDEVGISPGQWLLQQRLERARQLLEDTDMQIERIADRVGLGTATSLRQHLQKALGVSPSAYRSTFRATSVSSGFFGHSR